MKEVSRWDALSGTWDELSLEQRISLLNVLCVNEDRLNSDVVVPIVSQINNWSDLPIPLRTFLDSCFNGEKGEFSNEAREELCQSIASHLKAIEEAEAKLD